MDGAAREQTQPRAGTGSNPELSPQVGTVKTDTHPQRVHPKVGCPDIPIPAPANWPRLAAGTDYYCSRDIERGTWTVAVFAIDPKLTLISRQTFVVDDFGNLSPVADNGDSPNVGFWYSSFGTDVAADDWWQDSCDQAGHAALARADQQRTRDLLRPKPVTVEIVTEPEHPLCVASIVVGPDPRIDSPLYSLHVDREAPVLLSHAQLCALLLAAGQLVKACAPQGRLQ